jgi:hypothetical protein
MSAVALAEVQLETGEIEIWASGSSGKLSKLQKEFLLKNGVRKIISNVFHAEQNIGAALPKGAQVNAWGISWSTPNKPIPCPSCAPMVEKISGAIQGVD